MEPQPWVKKAKRCGPCDNCGCQVSTQWRVGPPCAPTLCNACGVCWGRKKKLPSVQRGGGAFAAPPLEHEAPASPLRAEEPAPAAHDLAAADEAELELAGLLLVLSATQADRSAASQGARQRAVRLARPDEVQGWTRRRTSATLSSGAPRAADTPLMVGAKRARAPTPEEASPAAPPEADAAVLKELPPMTPVGTAAAPPPPPPAAAAFAPYLWPLLQLQPHAFDLFRSALGGGCWSEAHNAWLSVPPDVAAAYHAAVAFAAAGAPPLAQRAEATTAMQVLPSRVISSPHITAIAPATG